MKLLSNFYILDNASKDSLTKKTEVGKDGRTTLGGFAVYFLGMETY